MQHICAPAVSAVCPHCAADPVHLAWLQTSWQSLTAAAQVTCAQCRSPLLHGAARGLHLPNRSDQWVLPGHHLQGGQICTQALWVAAHSCMHGVPDPLNVIYVSCSWRHKFRACLQARTRTHTMWTWTWGWLSSTGSPSSFCSSSRAFESAAAPPWRSSLTPSGQALPCACAPAPVAGSCLPAFVSKSASMLPLCIVFDCSFLLCLLANGKCLSAVPVARMLAT